MQRQSGLSRAKNWRPCLLVSGVVAATWLVAPIPSAQAADLVYPGTFVGRVGADSNAICTFWTGLGTDQYFWATDEDGDPLPMAEWMQFGSPSELSDLFNTLTGFAWMTSQNGIGWLQSDAGRQWLNSDAGKSWKNSYVRIEPASALPKPVEYVRICEMYGAGFYYIPGTETCLKVGGYIRPQIDAMGEPNDYGQLRTYINNHQRAYSSYQVGSMTSLDPPKAGLTGDGGAPANVTPPRPAAVVKEGDELRALAEILSGGDVTLKQDGQGANDGANISRSKKGGKPVQIDSPKKTASKDAKDDGPRTKGGDATKGGEAVKNGDATKDGEVAQSNSPADPAGDGAIRIHFKVNQATLDKSKVGPPVAGEQVQLMPAGDDPKLPSQTETRNAELENAGHDADGSRCTTQTDGTCKVNIDTKYRGFYGLPDYGVSLRAEYKLDSGKSPSSLSDYRPGTQLGMNYTTHMEVPNFVGYVAGWGPTAAMPDFSGLQGEGIQIRTQPFSFANTDYVQIGIQAVGDVAAVGKRIDAMVLAWGEKMNQLGVTMQLEGDICRLELPGPWIENMSAATERGGGVPTAAISLRADISRGVSR